MSARRLSPRSNAGIFAGVWLLSGVVGLLVGGGAPSSGGVHVFGVDSEGRDVLVRLLAGVLPTLGFGMAMAVMVALVGTLVGVVAGLGAGIFDLVFSRVSEGLSAFPTFLAVLVVQGLVGHANLWTLSLAIILTRSPDAARFARSETQRIRVSDFVLASHALGATRIDLLRRQLPPYVIPTVASTMKSSFVPCVVAETMASLLGVGLEGRLTWGALLREALVAPIPSLGIVFAVTLGLATLVLSMRALSPLENALLARARP